MRALLPARRRLQLACLAPALVLLGLVPRLPEHPSQEALGAGGALIACGLLLDACARVAGALAARAEADGPAWTWACALGGSPLVALHALRRPGASVRPEPELIAAVAATATVVATAFALIAGRLGD